MGMSYCKIFYSLKETLDLMSDDEAGRLFKAILAYGATRVEPGLRGSERLVFSMVRGQLDRDEEAYAGKVATNQANGKKGGRPKKPTGLLENPEKPSGFSENQTVFLETEKSQDKEEDKDKDKDKDKEEDHDEDNPFGDGAAPQRDDLVVYASSSLRGFNGGNMEELLSFRDSLPDDLIRHCIDQACAQGKPYYAYAKGILNRTISDGIRTVADAKAQDEQWQMQRQQPRKDTRYNAALDYNQRKYTDADFADLYVDLG